MQFISAILMLSSITCAGTNLKSGEVQDLKVNGKIVGTMRQVSETEQEFSYDSNRDGRVDLHWLTENSRFKTFERLDSTTGNLRTRSHYLKGTLNRIEVFHPNGEVRGIVNYPNGRDAASVELPGRKKLVEFIRN